MAAQRDALSIHADMLHALRQVNDAPVLLNAPPAPGRLAISVRPETLKAIERFVATLPPSYSFSTTL